MRLAHIHLPGLTPYHAAGRLQESILQKHFAAKDLLRPSQPQPRLAATDPRLPDPVVITAEFRPVYTFGRRQRDSVSSQQRLFLEDGGKSEVVQTQRGGQVTYHGPGQLVAYPIIDLRRHGVTPRCYVKLLEDTVMTVCKRLGVLNVERTEDPGVWVKGGQRKVCALGVHVRRGITTHGIGLNGFDRENWLSWGFGRIVACGLEGKEATWLSKEMDAGHPPVDDVRAVGVAFVKAFAAGLGGIESVYMEEQVSNPPP